MSFLKRFRKEFEEPPLALTFDDISLMPSDISYSSSRRDEDISLKTQISKNITLNIPLMGSYMPTVSGEKMGITLPQLGGMAWMPRSPEQLRQVQGVKRHENKIIEEPYKISHTATVGDVQQQLKVLGVGALLVMEGSNLVGLVSTRDVDLREDYNLPVTEVMTSRDMLVTLDPRGLSEDEITRKAVELFIEHRLEKIPLVSDDYVSGLVSKKDVKKMQNKLAVRDKDGHLIVGASVGLSRKENNDLDLDALVEQTAKLLDVGADIIGLAIANAYLNDAIIAVEALRKTFPDMDLAAGSVTEYEGTKRLFDAGADTVLLGIGPGSICETRIVAGVGVPQFTAIRLAQKAAREEGKFLIADGGISEPHHLNKALFAGASGVILGNVLAGTDDSPGEKERAGNTWVKIHRGLASDTEKKNFDAMNNRSREVDPNNLYEYVYKHVEAEGVESGFTAYRGDTVNAVRRIIGGLRSCMTYMGVKDIPSLWKRCDEGKYVRVTPAGSRESNPHDLLSFHT